MLFDRGLELENVCHDYILGYRSLLVYIEKYTIFRFDYCSPEFPFRWQVIGEHVRGNTSSGFTQVATLGILYLPFLFVLGFVCSVILVNRFRSNHSSDRVTDCLQCFSINVRLRWVPV